MGVQTAKNGGGWSGHCCNNNIVSFLHCTGIFFRKSIERMIDQNRIALLEQKIVPLVRLIATKDRCRGSFLLASCSYYW